MSIKRSTKASIEPRWFSSQKKLFARTTWEAIMKKYHSHNLALVAGGAALVALLFCASFLLSGDSMSSGQRGDSINLQATSTGPDDRSLTDPKSVVSALNPAPRPVPIDDLYHPTRRVSGTGWSPDGKQIVFTTDISGQPNVWKVRASGGRPVQLTHSDDQQYNAIWSPDGKWIAYQQEHAGNEIWDLYAIPSDGGEAVNLTNTPAVGELDPIWSHDGRTIAIDYILKGSSQYDVALLDWRTRKVHKLTDEQQPGYSWEVIAWSSDDKTIYANRLNYPFAAPITDSDIYRIDVATGKLENLTPHRGTIRYLVSALSPDDGTILLTSDAHDGHMNVALLEVASKEITWATDLKWEAHAGDFSPDGKSYTYVVDADGRTEAYLVDRSTNRPEKLVLPRGLNALSMNPTTEFAPQGDRVIVFHEASNQPRDLWVYNLNRRGILIS